MLEPIENLPQFAVISVDGRRGYILEKRLFPPPNPYNDHVFIVVFPDGESPTTASLPENYLVDMIVHPADLATRVITPTSQKEKKEKWASPLLKQLSDALTFSDCDIDGNEILLGGDLSHARTLVRKINEELMEQQKKNRPYFYVRVISHYLIPDGTVLPIYRRLGGKEMLVAFAGRSYVLVASEYEPVYEDNDVQTR